MTALPIDCHAHSTLSDGDLSVAEVAARVRARGVRPSVTDHITHDVARAISSVDAVRHYLDELERHDVARGGEFCWHDPLWREIPPELAARFTHRIGSLHAARLPSGRHLHAFVGRWPDGLTPSAYMEAHVTSAEQLVREMPIDIFAHPTLVPMAVRAMPAEELWSEAHEERLVRALTAAGVAFELSTRYRPHERLVRRAADLGVPFSLGSDGHTASQVGDVSVGLALAALVGLAPAELYDPFVHGSRTGCFTE